MTTLLSSLIQIDFDDFLSMELSLILIFMLCSNTILCIVVTRCVFIAMSEVSEIS